MLIVSEGFLGRDVLRRISFNISRSEREIKIGKQILLKKLQFHIFYSFRSTIKVRVY